MHLCSLLGSQPDLYCGLYRWLNVKFRYAKIGADAFLHLMHFDCKAIVLLDRFVNSNSVLRDAQNARARVLACLVWYNNEFSASVCMLLMGILYSHI